MTRTLLPFPWPSRSEPPEGYRERVAYLVRRTRSVEDFVVEGGELVRADREIPSVEVVNIFIPNGAGMMLLAGGVTNTRIAANLLEELTVKAGLTVVLDQLVFDMPAVDTAFPNDQWKRGFDVTGGYIQNGVVYGDRIEVDELLNPIRTRSLPNEVGITMQLTGANQKVRLLPHGRVQFPGVQLTHLEHRNHPQLGDPWPAILEAIRVLSTHMRPE